MHLVKRWLPSLEKKLEILSEAAHPDFRVFMSAEPASSLSAHIIPQVFNLPLVVKSSSIKMVFKTERTYVSVIRVF